MRQGAGGMYEGSESARGINMYDGGMYTGGAHGLGPTQAAM